MTTYHEWMKCVVPGTMGGGPTLAVPAGFDRRGLPIGLQLIQQEKELTQGSQVTNIKATTYTNYINQYTARDTAGKGYGNLAANIGPTSENPFTNTIPNQSFNCSKESVFRQFRTSHASHSWEALSNHMWPEKPIQAG